ncbi:alpha/beta-hydrolase [Trichoderma citrinoviride]|uniref:Alpha/beta-hydrolase n=1 Tax=Trichoderma citrinoviride TaxID=58853 RepID=A0A2T4B585_9HYPO|nr:alpha/beta-hydrolase [Trichoderma citrinoviride]PTB64493.1 alpha/beta-hydrolase [Trichoderma citrinoviride]
MGYEIGTVVKSGIYALAASTVGYFVFLGVLTIPACQNQAIYLNKITLTWGQDVNVPEQWGFLHNQVTPFMLDTSDGETLHAWHILPLDLYRNHEKELIDEPAGLALDITSRLSFKLLREDLDSLLVLYLHGAAGTLGSGWRPPSYRAMSALNPDKIHTVAIDYRGFGTSTGTPSEPGLLNDALALAKWAIEVAGIPPSRIVLFSQSLGTAVTLSLAHHLATQVANPIFFAGMVLVAPFANVEELTATYRIAGTIPLLDPIARFPWLLDFFNGFIIAKWPSTEKIAEFVRFCEMSSDDAARYDITIIHAEDDYDIPWEHSDKLYWHAVNASSPHEVSYEELEDAKAASRSDLHGGGWVVEQKTQKGYLREAISRWGLHDRIMSYPVVSLAVWRAFQRAASE